MSVWLFSVGRNIVFSNVVAKMKLPPKVLPVIHP